MSRKTNSILELTAAAIAAGEPLEVRQIRALRDQSKKAVSVLTAVFWVGIIIFNVALWVPLPFAVNQTLLYLVAAVALLVAVVVPIIGLRKHKLNLEYLKVNKENLKKKTVNEAGRVYMDKVKQRERPFINAEYELLSGSKWAEQDTE
jgi:hypothetical protein